MFGSILSESFGEQCKELTFLRIMNNIVKYGSFVSINIMKNICLVKEYSALCLFL